MENDKFMEQKIGDMTPEEIAIALKIKQGKKGVKEIKWVGHLTKGNQDSYTIMIDTRDQSQKDLMNFILTLLHNHKGTKPKEKEKEVPKDLTVEYDKSPLQNPEILKIVQQLCEMDKSFTKMKEYGARRK